MALATTTSVGSIILAGDLTGNATAPQLRITGVAPGSYSAASLVIDSKGRVIHASSVSSFQDATTTSKGTVQIGDNINVASGVISVPAATNTTLGAVTSGDSTAITISAGAINVGSNIPKLNAQNVFSKAIGQAVATTSASSYAPDLSAANVFYISTSTLPNLTNPTNMVAGSQFTIITETSNTGVPTGATSGYQDVNVGGAKTGSSATGLSNAALSAGYQDVLVGGTATSTTSTNLVLRSATAIYLYFTSNNTGLPNTSTVYKMTFNLGSGSISVNATGSAAQTISQLGTIIQGSGSGYGVSVDTTNHIITITSTTNVWTVGGVQTSCADVSPGIFANATNMATPNAPYYYSTYNATMTIDGSAYVLAIPSNAHAAALTRPMNFSELITAIGTTYATPSLVSGNLRVMSKTSGGGSTVALTNGSAPALFANLAGYTGLGTAVAGAGSPYTASVTVNGVGYNLSISGASSQTYTTLLSSINTSLSGVASASLVGGNIRVTSLATGASSTIAMANTGGNPLFSNLTSWVGFNTAVSGVASYTSYPSTFGTAYKFSNIAPASPLQKINCIVHNSSVLCTYE